MSEEIDKNTPGPETNSNPEPPVAALSQNKSVEGSGQNRQDSSPGAARPTRMPARRPPYGGGGYRNSGQNDGQGGQPRKFMKQYKKYRKKVCRFCAQKQVEIDYKGIDVLEKFITDRGKILPRRITGTCSKHQRNLAKAIKRARSITLLPFTVQ